MLFPDRDDDEVGVLLEIQFQGLVELDEVALEHVRILFPGVVVFGELAAVHEDLHPVDVEPLVALHAHLQLDRSADAVETTRDDAGAGLDLEIGTCRKDHASGLGVAAHFTPVDLGGIIGRTFHVGPPAAHAIAMDLVGVADGDGLRREAVVQQLQPDEFPDRRDDPAGATGASGGEPVGRGRKNLAGAVVLHLDPIDEATEVGEAAICLPVLVAVDEVFDHVRVIDMDPAIGFGALPVAQGDGVETRVLFPHGRAPVLQLRIGGEGKGIEVGS